MNLEWWERYIASLDEAGKQMLRDSIERRRKWAVDSLLQHKLEVEVFQLNEIQRLLERKST